MESRIQGLTIIKAGGSNPLCISAIHSPYPWTWKMISFVSVLHSFMQNISALKKCNVLFNNEQLY